MNINDLFKNLSQNEIKQINDFLASAQAKNIQSSLSEKDKQKLLERFSSLDSNAIKSKLNGISKEDIIRLIK